MISDIRARCAIARDEGPSDAAIAEALEGFAGQFDYWFDRVIANAVKQYRKLIIKRINPFVRGIEYQGMDANQVGGELVRDYVNRNFVTAGGWAIERMAIALGSNNAKAAATGIDLHRIDPVTGNHSLYIIKSGAVTRNSDILKALKTHAASAQRLLQQGGNKVAVFANYAVAAGATTSTIHDNIYRPSSAAFWAEITDLGEDKAIRLAYEISREAANIIRREAAPHIRAMSFLVSRYIGQEADPNLVDWDFLFDRTTKTKEYWSAPDKARHASAWRMLLETGYRPAAAAKRDPEVPLEA